MATINYATKEISCKVVYYGPGLCGKTTNLQVIHQRIPLHTRSDMISLATETDRTLFFDFLPLDLGNIKGFNTRFQLYTVPGQVYYNATRKLVLRGVDGVIFVADSQMNKMRENVESLQNLFDNLMEYGYDVEDVTLVLQYNKRDLSPIYPVEDLDKHLNPRKLQTIEASAVKGVGVFETLKIVSKFVIDRLNTKYSQGGDDKRPTTRIPRTTQAPPLPLANLPSSGIPGQIAVPPASSSVPKSPYETPSTPRRTSFRVAL